MENYGIGEKTLNWVQDFLTDRKQKVSVNGMDSTTPIESYSTMTYQ
jgi:hypothetical protein